MKTLTDLEERPRPRGWCVRRDTTFKRVITKRFTLGPTFKATTFKARPTKYINEYPFKNNAKCRVYVRDQKLSLIFVVLPAAEEPQCYKDLKNRHYEDNLLSRYK